jgi:hypothetical protein
METKENEVETLDKLAMSITDGNMGAEELLSTLKSLYEDYLHTWLGVEREDLCTDKPSLKNQLFTLRCMIETLSR